MVHSELLFSKTNNFEATDTSRCSNQTIVTIVGTIVRFEVCPIVV